ncbi:hypothetical protein KBA01_22010 [Kozakia baliensis]|nr:hypothetical protein KBA01_22010 [Kozakia baliensis]
MGAMPVILRRIGAMGDVMTDGTYVFPRAAYCIAGHESSGKGGEQSHSLNSTTQ